MIKSKRSGFTVVELLAAIAILAVLLTTTVQMLRLVVVQRQRNEDRQAACEAAASLMELITALPDSEIRPQVLRQPAIQPILEGIQQRWEVDLQITPVDDPSGQRIDLRLRRLRSRKDEPPLNLTAWRYR